MLSKCFLEILIKKIFVKAKIRTLENIQNPDFYIVTFFTFQKLF
jgi:hypothetical protein